MSSDEQLIAELRATSEQHLKRAEYAETLNHELSRRVFELERGNAHLARVSERVSTVAVLAASEMNAALTILLTSALGGLRVTSIDHPARTPLLDIYSAAQRVAWRSSTILEFALRNGAQPSACDLDRLIAQWKSQQS